MKTQRYSRSHSTLAGLALALAFAAAAPSARANVYASNVKINSGITNITVGQGTNVDISYILNEAASSGVTIRILYGATALRTISLTNGSAGTARGLNTVTWDGKADGGAAMPGGDYSVSITAASTGYAGWTQITDDNNPGNYSWVARGIAVNRNTNSPHYGRVFVGNSYPGPDPINELGDRVGIQKLNADGSYADEGGFSDGGVAWPGQTWAPWRIRVSEDDHVYVHDFYSAGDIYRFDATISPDSMLHVFAPATDLSQGTWSGFRVVGTGTNTVLWAADARENESLGISKFAVKPDGTFDPAAPIRVVGVTNLNGNTNSGVLNVGPYAVDLDRTGALYTLQFRDSQGDSSALVFRFPAYDPSTNGGLPQYTADWTAGPGDDYCGAHGIAVDPTGTYVAAAFWGYRTPPVIGAFTNGNIKIFNAATGMLVTNLDLGVSYTNAVTEDPLRHADTDADWDAVGNLYYLDDWGICWRAFSPPGANQATTVALATVTVIAPEVPIYITSIGVSNGLVTIRFTAGSSDPASVFELLSTPIANGAYSPANGANITGGGGSYQATVLANGPAQFYRIKKLATVTVRISSLSVAAGLVTINFTGPLLDSASAFTLLASETAGSGYSPAAGASITLLSPGQFQATVPVNGPRQFYRIRK